MKNKIFSVVFIFVFIASAFCGIKVAQAADNQDFPFISVENYSVTKEKIIPGSDFILKLTLKNNSNELVANNVVVTVSCPQGVSPKYGTLGQVYVKQIQANASIDILFELTAIEDIYSFYLDFTVTVLADESNNELILRIPVGTDAPFNVTDFAIDEKGTEGETISASIAFKVIGTEFAKNVAISATYDGTEVGNIFIGTMSPGTTKTQFISIPVFSSGEHEITLSLSYEDNLGKTNLLKVGSGKVTVKSAEIVPSLSPVEGGEDNNDSSANTKLLLGIAGVICIMIFSVTYLFFSRKGKR